MKPTKLQKEALNNILEFIESNELFYTLSGFAGTGKTTVIKEVIKKIAKGKKITVSAPTHQAKDVVATATKLKGETIQSVLGLKPNIELDNFDPNKPQFDDLSEARIAEYDIIIIDESSMIGQKAFKLIYEKAIQFKTKIIFLGDEYQLPPVKEKLSQVFELPNIIKLTDVVRQELDNPNTELITIARNDVINKTDYLFNKLKTTSTTLNNDKGFYLLNKIDFYEKIIPYFKEDFESGKRDTVVLAWTNDLVNELNTFIRNKINLNDELVTSNDLLIAKKSVNIMESKGVYLPILQNSLTYKVKDVELKSIRLGDINVNVYACIIDRHAYNFYILHKSSYETYAMFYDNLLKEALSTRRWHTFYKFTEQILLMEKLFLRGKLLLDPHVSYAHAITIHKSQGSTYKNVGIFASQLFNLKGGEERDNERRRLLYVALSRTNSVNLIV